MVKNKIASRNLVIQYNDGNSIIFEIDFGIPYKVDKNEFCVEICSSNIIFYGIQKIYGIDSIDCLDYAIQFIDFQIDNFRDGCIVWPDGTKYSRVFVDKKMAWG